MAEIGIDLGTTNSAVAVLKNKPEIIQINGNQTMPSVIASDSFEILVGQLAKDVSSIPNIEFVTSVKRLMGTDTKIKLGGVKYLPEEMSAMILKELKKAAEYHLDEVVDSAVITVPAYFSGAQNEATHRSGTMAGFRSIRLLAEPVAASLAYGAEDIALVYDFGGGTLDVAIIDCFDYTMISLAGDNYLGGDDFDGRLLNYLIEEIKKETGLILEDKKSIAFAKELCEKAKKELSMRNYTYIAYIGEIQGSQFNISLKITREEFENMIEDLVDRSIDKIKEAIELASEKEDGFSKEKIDTILLVGGSTFVPLVRKKLTEFFGKEPSKKVNPTLAVAMGAAIHTATGFSNMSGHRIRIEPIPEITSNKMCDICGRTTPDSEIDIIGGMNPIRKTADENGRFFVSYTLQPDGINDIIVIATDQDGNVRKSGFSITHDSSFKGEEIKPRRSTAGIGGGLIPRSIGVRLTGQNDILGIIIPAQTEIPCSILNKTYSVKSFAPNMPGYADIEIYEGDIPYAPLNTHLATLRLETQPTNNRIEPVEIYFQITEDHLLTVSARLMNFPDKTVTAKVKCKSASGSNLHIVERADRILNLYGTKLSSEERGNIIKTKHTIVDYIKLYKNESKYDYILKLKELGSALKEYIDKIDLLEG
ncbi:MAG: Hsp70 family protein [Desulfobacterales bacterium]|nr:Hsp70 family protein [Desulfobacterales bacterium]